MTSGVEPPPLSDFEPGQNFQESSSKLSELNSDEARDLEKIYAPTDDNNNMAELVTPDGDNTSSKPVNDSEPNKAKLGEDLSIGSLENEAKVSVAEMKKF